MKSTFYAIALIFSVSLLAFKVNPKEKVFKIPVNTKTSTVSWLGKKVTGQHSGNVSLQSGSVEFSTGKLKTGMFEIDMNSISCTDLKGEYANKLVGHLKSDDFFGVAKFPKATLKITNVSYTEKNKADVTGDLTIKGITKAVSFPAIIEINGKNLTANATISVDRTLYDIKYGSGSFFDNLGDKAIDNEFKLTVNLKTGN
ncbi:MAG TPA: YceI family protein [Saprospiraceae bacterium]|nr:YceI family protein [Saprospiraceae bacterium]